MFKLMQIIIFVLQDMYQRILECFPDEPHLVKKMFFCSTIFLKLAKFIK